MIRTISLTTEITSSRELSITLPADVPAGPAEIVVVVSSTGEQAGATLGDLLSSEFVGMWKDREDIADSRSFARRLREEAWRRSA